MTATTAIAVAMNTKVAAIERGERRAMPHTPWPEVQPPPSRVPKPTSRPAAMTMAKLDGIQGVGTGRPTDEAGEEREAPAAVVAGERLAQDAAHPGDAAVEQHQQHGGEPDERAADEGGNRIEGCHD